MLVHKSSHCELSTLKHRDLVLKIKYKRLSMVSERVMSLKILDFKKRSVRWVPRHCIYSSTDRVAGFGPDSAGSNPAKCTTKPDERFLTPSNV